MDRVYAGRHETGRAPWAGGWQPGRDPLEIRKTDNACWADRTIAALAMEPVIGRMAARLPGAETIRLWHDQLLCKPGGGSASGNVGWHQDYGYWQCADVPDLERLESEMRIPPGAEFGKSPLRLRAGAASFHHALTIHGSGPNTTDRPRRSLVVHMMAGHVRYRAGSPNDNHMNVSLLGGRDGDLFAGDAFPVIWRPA